jgi:hypothetical protein
MNVVSLAHKHRITASKLRFRWRNAFLRLTPALCRKFGLGRRDLSYQMLVFRDTWRRRLKRILPIYEMVKSVLFELAAAVWSAPVQQENDLCGVSTPRYGAASSRNSSC